MNTESFVLFANVLLVLLISYNPGNAQQKNESNSYSPLNLLWESDTLLKTVESVVIPLDKKVLSGIGLKPVKSSAQPNRKLFQKRLHRGKDISVYVVSSETATASWDNYSIDEFIYVINGRARLNPKFGEEQYYTIGDFFMAPKGYTGDWETQGGHEFYIELSVVANHRANESTPPEKALPHLMNKDIIAGIGMTQTENTDVYKDILYQGKELLVQSISETPGTKSIKTYQEQLVYIISGQLEIPDMEGNEQIFQTGDFFFLPEGFAGTWTTNAHGLFRTLRVTATK